MALTPAKIKSQISGLRRAKAFVDYRNSLDFARKLALIVDAITEHVLESDPKVAAQLYQLFLETDKSTFGRIDDSGGWASDVYRSVPELLARAHRLAGTSSAQITQLVEQMHQDNDFGAHDGVVRHCAPLLDAQDLEKLVDKYLNPDIVFLDKYDSLHNSIFVQELAQGIGDPELYERAYRYKSDGLNSFQAVSVAGEYIRSKQYPRAIELLEAARFDERAPSEIPQELFGAYLANGQTQEALDLAKQMVSNAFSRTWIDNACKLLDADQRQDFTAHWLAHHAAAARINWSIFLHYCDVGDFAQAESYILARHQDIKGYNYGIRKYAQILAKEACPLGAIVIRRALVEHVLEEKQQRSYKYAASDINVSSKLAAQVTDWRDITTQDTWLSQIHAAHYRKTSLWKHVKVEGYAG